MNVLSSPNPAFLAAVIASATSFSVFAQTSFARSGVAVASFDAAPLPTLFTARTLKA